MKTFLDDLNAEPISKSYGFKSEGRKKNADPSRKGHYLMPGLYQRKDSIVDELEKKKMTYSFAAVTREDKNAVVTGMKDLVIIFFFDFLLNFSFISAKHQKIFLDLGILIHHSIKGRAAE